MIYKIYHETKFDYVGLVTFSHNIARLKPKDSNTQKLLEYSLKIEPTPYETSEFIDYFENTNNFMLIRESHKSLKVSETFFKASIFLFICSSTISTFEEAITFRVLCASLISIKLFVFSK